MDHQRIPRHALYREVPGLKRGPNRPRTNWRGVVKKDLQKMDLTWEDVGGVRRNGWREGCFYTFLLFSPFSSIPFLLFPFSPSPPPFSPIFSFLPISFPSLRSRAPLNQLVGLEESCKIPSESGPKTNWCNLELSSHWWRSL